MTIFDSIKYPISDKITIQQLSALPNDIFEEIRRQMAKQDTFGGIELAQLMRKVILEWNTKESE